MDSIIIKPLCGLSNKLRVIFSYLRLANEQKKQLIVVWKVSSECPGHFLDYFEPIEGCIFIKDVTHVDYETCHSHYRYPPKYSQLKLLPDIIKKLEARISIMGTNYTAVHIRRTDHINLAKHHNAYTSDEEFIEFIDKYKDTNLYIATDNKETYSSFQTKYIDIIKFPYHTTYNTLRETTLEDSILDLYMCVYAIRFKGSNYSSFSQLIHSLRGVKRCKKCLYRIHSNPSNNDGSHCCWSCKHNDNHGPYCEKLLI